MALSSQPLLKAQNPPPRIQDEGGTLEPYFNLDCVGGSVTCSTSGVNATLLVDPTAQIDDAIVTHSLNDSAHHPPLTVIGDTVNWLKLGDAQDQTLSLKSIREDDIVDLAHTVDTNANTICSGTDVYLDGEGNCDTITPGGSPGGADTQIQYNSSGAFAGDADLTWNDTTNTMTLPGTSVINGGKIGLNGTANSGFFSLDFGTRTSGQELGPIFSNLTYNGFFNIAASVQSQINFDGIVAGPTSYGILATSTLGTNPSGLQSIYGIQANAGFTGGATTLGAAEQAAIYGIDLRLMDGLTTFTGTGHDASSQVFMLGIAIPNFGTPVGPGLVIKHGILSAEPINLQNGAAVGFNASAFTQATTRMFENTGTTELEVDVQGTNVLQMNAAQIEPQVTIDGGRNLFYAVPTGNINITPTASFTDITLTSNVVDSYYSHTASAADITIQNDGLYRIQVDFSCLQTGGNNRSTFECKLQENVGAGYVDIPNSRCFMYSRNNADGETSCSVNLLRDLNSEDSIKAACRKMNGAANPALIDVDGTRLNIEFMRDS